MKKKIVIIGPAHPLRGGLASYDERLAKEFIDKGFDTILYTFSLQYPGFLFPGTTQYSSEPAPHGIPIKVCINSVNPLNWVKVGNELKNLHADHIIVRFWLPFMGPCLGTILRIAKKNGFSRITCIADNIIPHEKRFGDRGFTRYFIKPIDAFITMSNKVKKDLRMIAKDTPVTIVNHPLYDNFGERISKSEARDQLNIDRNIRVLLFFGFIRKYKGLDILLDAVRILKEKNLLDNFKLLIAGEYYEDSKPYTEQIAANNISDLLILRTLFIPDSEVKNYLCAADVVIQPYRSATQSGVTPLAYHFEVPMIVTNVGGLPALVPDGKVGLVTEPNAIDLANTIVEYFKLGEDQFLPHLREEKKQYSWGKLVDAIIN